jgi:hypothetical protein
LVTISTGSAGSATITCGVGSEQATVSVTVQ